MQGEILVARKALGNSKLLQMHMFLGLLNYFRVLTLWTVVVLMSYGSKDISSRPIVYMELEDSRNHSPLSERTDLV